MSTDIEWEKWGRQDPYYGVITDPRFRSDRLTETDRTHFFETGRVHAQYVIQVARQRLDPLFTPRSMLDFGCGVGRVLLPAARFIQRVVGIDVSDSMLAEARRNCESEQLDNVELLAQGGVEGLAPRSFDLVHSAIVLQHIDPDRGTRLFGDLVALVGPNGVGAIQLTYSKSQYAQALGQPPAPVSLPLTAQKRLLRGLLPSAEQRPAEADPAMQMNPYPLTPLFFQLQATGIRNVHVEFTDHGGELGLFLFFQRTGQEALAPHEPAQVGSPHSLHASKQHADASSVPRNESPATPGQNGDSRLYAALLDDAGIDSPEQLSSQQKMWFDYAISSNRRGSELVHSLSSHFTGSLARKRVLDIGCGFGGTAIAAARAGATVVGVDTSEKNLRLARQNLLDFAGVSVDFQAVDVADADAIEPLGQFDLVIADNVIERVASPAKLLAAAALLMKPGAHLYVTAPNARSVGMVEADCHYGMQGASLLTPHLAELLLNASATGARQPYEVSHYLSFDQYFALFSRYGLEPRSLLPQQASDAEVLALREQVAGLAQRLADRDWGTLQGPVLEACKRWADEVEADWTFFSRLSDPALRTGMAGRIVRDYGHSLWYFVATKGPSWSLSGPPAVDAAAGSV